jgi:hypothetical protein
MALRGFMVRMFEPDPDISIVRNSEQCPNNLNAAGRIGAQNYEHTQTAKEYVSTAMFLQD